MPLDPVQTALEFENHYDPGTSLLEAKDPFQLLIMVILSAQTTDAQVNIVAPALFAAFPEARALAAGDPAKIEELVKSTGFYRVKARNIRGAAQKLVENHGGRVPGTMEELVEIPGVGRKSAGVILHHVYGKPAIIVDTHFGRVVRRLGFSTETDPVKLERDVANLLPDRLWSSFSMTANLHGRALCHARRPSCSSCFLEERCPKAGVAAAG